MSQTAVETIPATQLGLLAALGRALALSALLGGLLGLYVAYRIATANEFGGSDWRMIGLDCGALYALLLAPVGVLAWALAAGCHFKSKSRVRATPAVLAVVCGLAVAAWARRVFETESVALAAGAGIGAILVAAGLLWPLTWALRRIIRWPLALFLLIAATGVYLVAGSAHTRRLAGVQRVGEELFQNAMAVEHVNDRRVLLIGLDGASWDYVSAMMQRGELPTLKSIAERGVCGPLRSEIPTRSPLIWTSIATGMKPKDHGVEDFVGHQAPGVRQLILRSPAGLGLDRLLRAGDRWRITPLQPVTSHDCRRPRMWDLIEAAGGQSAVLGWWATWPAHSRTGVVVSDMFYYERTAARLGGNAGADAANVSPPEMAAELEPLRAKPEQIDDARIRRFMDVTDEQIAQIRSTQYQRHQLESEFLYLHGMDETYRNIALKLLAARPTPHFVGAYFRGIDIISHCALRYGTPLDQPPREGDFGDTVRRYYIYTDELVKELLDAAGSDVTVMIVSDHGFEQLGRGLFGHDNAPPGIFFAAGEPFNAGEPAGDLSIYDVFPTLLYLYDMSIPEDAVGRPALSLMKEEYTSQHAVRMIPSYGLVARTEATAGSHEEHIQRLRALGYLP